MAIIIDSTKRVLVQGITGREGRARTKLMRDFGNSPADRRKRVALIGLRGAGKSTLGALLAKDRGVPFIELDREVERDAGTSLSEIFLLYGQQGYRRYERRCLENVLQRSERCVILHSRGICNIYTL